MPFSGWELYGSIHAAQTQCAISVPNRLNLQKRTHCRVGMEPTHFLFTQIRLTGIGQRAIWCCTASTQAKESVPRYCRTHAPGILIIAKKIWRAELYGSGVMSAQVCVCLLSARILALPFGTTKIACDR